MSEHNQAKHNRDVALASFTKFRWFFIVLIVLAGVINYMDRSTLAIGNTTIASDLHLSTLQMGALLSAFSWPYALANLPAGYLIDRYLSLIHI